ncbi:MAG TPA: ElyC/SanA/YdcF family protein, partial [Candidatus Paceibacterota bacterium]
MQRFLGGLALMLLCALTLLLIVPLLMQVSVSDRMYASAESVPETDVAVVLGASVARGMPSPVLAARADEAVELYIKGKVKKILVTGDNGALTHDEVTPVRKYLLAAGIPAEDIFLDHAGFDTYSSVYRAQAVFGAQTATVVTQNFHLPRALFLARAVGMNAVGVTARGGEYSWQAYMREIPAS